MDHPPPAISDATGVGPNKIYHAGTLTYTKAALAGLFFWLLWGDFCYTVMESVTGPIMQLKFQKLDASNTEIGLILGTIPSIVYSILNPIITATARGEGIPADCRRCSFLNSAIAGLPRKILRTRSRKPWRG